TATVREQHTEPVPRPDTNLPGLPATRLLTLRLRQRQPIADLYPRAVPLPLPIRQPSTITIELPRPEPV
ncbi:MAG: hypothetical protein JO362_24750, partial [Streptomycetaceae bacterium]|nr:hypothetical protein [Streptomycetaceae bacterium]